MATFDELVAEGDAVPVAGWDFSWFEGRATEQRPDWGYAKLIGQRMATATAGLDVQTGGGEVLASIPMAPRLLAAFLDVAAVVYFLRKVRWIVPDFTVHRYHDRLAALHELLTSDGPFVAHSTRFLIEARRA